MEPRELPYTPSEIKILPEKFQEEQEKKEEKDEVEEAVEELDDDEEDIQDVFEEAEGHGFNRLFRAVDRGEIDTVRNLLISSVDISMLDPNKNIRSQLHAIVRELLNKKERVDPRTIVESNLLQLTHDNCDVGITHELLKNNTADTSSDSCHTPLPIAPELGCVEIIVKALIAYVGGINAVDKNDETALHLVARHERNVLVKILLKQSTETEVRSHFILAEKQICPSELELSQQSSKHKITPHGAVQGDNCNPSKAQLGPHASVATPLQVHLATDRGHAEIVDNLILSGANVNACNKDSMTPLHIACQNGHSSIVDVLLDNQATVDVTKQNLETPFYLAANNGHADVVDVLLRRGICEFVLNHFNETPLHVAVIGHRTKVVEVILKHSYRILGKSTKCEQIVQVNSTKLTETRNIIATELKKSDGRCISAGIVWTETCTPLETMLESDGFTALDIAVKSIQPKMVKILLSADRYVYSEKHMRNSFYCMIKAITKPGHQYQVNSNIKHTEIIDIMQVLCYEIQHRMKCKMIKEIAQLLLSSNKFNVNSQDDELNTPLHAIMLHRRCFNENKTRHLPLKIQTTDELIELLLEKGADFNMKNAFGETPLIIASERGCLNAIQKLIDWEQKSGFKLDLDARDQYGATALIKAAETHNVSVMRLLLNHNVSVNLHDYYGFTALHAVVYEQNRSWFDLHFFCKGMRNRINDIDKHPVKRPWVEHRVGDRAMNLHNTVERLCKKLDNDEKTMRLKEEMVKLLLAIDETNVNAANFIGHTPLDLAGTSSKRITSETFEALKARGAIRNLPEPMDEASLEVARVDERGRDPLHRLIISRFLAFVVEDIKADKREERDRSDIMVYGILLNPENFRESANATDDKGRTPLHYAIIASGICEEERDLLRWLVEIGSNVNAVDIYGKTPLHYAEANCQYRILIEHGADESIKDKNGHTPKFLRKLKDLVNSNTDNADKSPLGKKPLYTPMDISRMLSATRVTELSKRKLFETVRIYSQSPCQKESSEKAIWDVWMQNDFFTLNRRVSKLKPAIQRFIDRLADGIKEKDERFECQPLLVGSADQETKAVFSTDFDVSFPLKKFSQLCDVFPHPLGPNGYFQLRRKSDNAIGRQSDGEFDCFFNLDHCLLTDEVNSRFQIILAEVFRDPFFWQDEHLFEWNFALAFGGESRKPADLCKNVQLKMINPIEDGEGGFLFVNVSIDAVACIQVDDSCLRDQLSVGRIPAGRADGCILVFDRPRFDPTKPHGAHSFFSDTYARISFAPLESRIIRESSSLVKAAYIVCKFMLYNHTKATYQLKTSLLFCMEALKIPEEYERKDDNSFTPEELAFWVERLMFCFCELYQHDVYPCYFMPSFKQRVVELTKYYMRIQKADGVDVSLWYKMIFLYSAAFDIYLEICPDDTTIDIPIIQNGRTYDLNEGSLIANQDPKWEHFDREEFIRKLASRIPSY